MHDQSLLWYVIIMHIDLQDLLVYCLPKNVGSLVIKVYSDVLLLFILCLTCLSVCLFMLLTGVLNIVCRENVL